MSIARRLPVAAFAALFACGSPPPDIRPGQPVVAIDTAPGIGSIVDVDGPNIPLSPANLQPWPFASNIDEALLQCRKAPDGVQQIIVTLSGSDRRVLFGAFNLETPVAPPLLAPNASLAPLLERTRPLCADAASAAQ